MLFGALIGLQATAFVSCKDYDDDIAALRSEITTNATDLKSLVDEKMKNVETQISTMQSTVSGLESAYKAADKALEDAITNATNDAKGYADGLNTAMDTRVTAAEGKIATLTGAESVEGSVAKALKDAKDSADTKVGSVAKGNDGIVIGGTVTAPTVGVQIDDTAGNSIQIVEGKGLRVEVPAVAGYSVVKDEN